MKKNLFAVVLLSFIFAISLLVHIKLAAAILLMIVYLSIILRSEQSIIKVYFFIYLVLAGFAGESGFSISGNQSINLLGILNLMLILIFYLKLLDFLQLRKECWNKSLIYPIFLFALYLVLTIPFSTSLTASVRDLIRMLSAFSFYLLTYFIIVNNKNAEEGIFKLITAIFIPLLIYGIIEYFTAFNIFQLRSISVPIYEDWHVIGQFKRIRTVFSGAPHYSFVLLMFLPLYLYYFTKRRERVYFYGFILSLFMINVLLTFTRITWGAVAIQIIFFIFLFRPKKILRFVLPLGIIFVTMSSQIIARATTVDGSALGRMDVFLYGFSIFKDHPAFGSGLGTILFSYKTAAHGDYMKMFAETGIFGGTGYLIILFTNLIFAVKNFKENDFAKVAFLTIIGFMVFSMTDNGLAYSHIFWALLGIYNGLIVRENFCKRPLLLAHNKALPV
ncbi:putative membrane protein [Candidatus Kuenenia stuttgartiensis]|uniref:Putative membrane protein n=1 Tax=Kuenenia stuttgartiensis TaxID=174633 RepID=Q1Q6V8_KUEST|nr:O-antigen ligase family protein [Candidatus Kuenenia stuttgartiensis]QII12885.1 putative membrane protein [Candidatus Kuenenia stuttgartiensis]CAJ73305.1 hypothetical protein kuste2557 [Candidatus Kuenenia stuttgartiensis]